MKDLVVSDPAGSEVTVVSKGEVLVDDSTKKDAKQSKEKGKSTGWRSVMVGIVPGIVLDSAVKGTVGALGEQSTLPGQGEVVGQEPKEIDVSGQEEQVEDGGNVIQGEPESSDLSLSSVPQATGVDDGMSFSQAFASARRELGAGGVFSWRGNLYNTYYKEEWDEMSLDEKHDFYNQVVYGQEQNSDEEIYQSEEIVDAELSEASEEVVHIISSEPAPEDTDSFVYPMEDTSDGLSEDDYAMDIDPSC